MSKIAEFLGEAGLFYLATVDGDQPALRPLGLFIEDEEGVVRFGIGDFKAVYRQLKANPKCQIVACKGMDWLRYTGEAVFEDDPKYVEIALEKVPPLRDIYNEETGNKMAVFRLENADARIIHMMGEGDKIL